MPSLSDNYDVLLEFNNDTQHPITIQLLRDYGHSTGAVVLLNTSESVTLVLESGSAYRYALKMRTQVVSITARSWRNVQCQLSHIFSGPEVSTPSACSASNGISIDGLFNDFRMSIWNES